MPYSYNSDGQIVYTEGPGNAVTNAAKGHIIPHTPGTDDYLSDLGGGSFYDQMLGPPPAGYKWDANGGLKKLDAMEQFAGTVMTPEGFALGIGGMALAPALLGALGIGGGAAATGGTLANSAGVGSGIFNAAATAGLPGALSGTAAGLGAGAAGALGAGLGSSVGAGAAGGGAAGAGAGTAGLGTLANSAGVGSGISNAAALGATPGALGGGATGAGLSAGSILGTLGDIGQIAGKAGSSAANGRYQEGQLLNARDRAAADLFNTESNNALNASKMGIAAPNARTKQVLLGELLANSHGSPQPIGSGRQHIVQYQTGLDALGPNGHQAGDELTRQALQALLTKSDVPTYPTAPTLSAIPKAGVGENILGGVGIGASLLSALGKLGQ